MSSNVMQVAKTGLNAQQARIQTISNNLANVNTVGYKITSLISGKILELLHWTQFYLSCIGT